MKVKNDFLMINNMVVINLNLTIDGGTSDINSSCVDSMLHCRNSIKQLVDALHSMFTADTQQFEATFRQTWSDAKIIQKVTDD